MFTAPACPVPCVERVLTYTGDVDPTQHIQTLPHGEQPPVVPPIYTATGMFDRYPGTHPVEILLCADMQDISSFWARQYAVRVARELGSTALVLLEEKERTIEVFGPSGSIPGIPIACADDVISVIAWLSSFIARTIVVPSGWEPDKQIVGWQVPIRLMTSTDEIAIAQTKAQSKWLADYCSECDLEPPQLDLLIIEKDSARAQQCADRFIRDAQHFLGLEVTVLDFLQGSENITRPFQMSFDVPSSFESSDTLKALGCVATPKPPDTVQAKLDQDELDDMSNVDAALAKAVTQQSEDELTEALAEFATKAAVAAAVVDADSPKPPPPPRTSLFADLQGRMKRFIKALLHAFRA